MRDWQVETGDVRTDIDVAGEILEFIESQGVLSIIMTDGVWAARTSKASITRGNGAHLPIVHSGTGATALRES